MHVSKGFMIKIAETQNQSMRGKKYNIIYYSSAGPCGFCHNIPIAPGTITTSKIYISYLTHKKSYAVQAKQKMMAVLLFIAVLVPLEIKPVRWMNEMDFLKYPLHPSNDCNDGPVQEKNTFFIPGILNWSQTKLYLLFFVHCSGTLGLLPGIHMNTCMESNKKTRDYKYIQGGFKDLREST